MKRGYNTPSMMVSQSVPGKPYAVPANWARVIHTSDGEAVTSPRGEAPQIVYATDGTQYYAVAKGSGFTPTMAGQHGGSVIVSPGPVAAQASPQGMANGVATSTATTNYPAYVTVPIPATSTAIFHPVAIPVQGIHTPAFVLRPPYHGTSVYSPNVIHTTTTTAAGHSPIPIYQNVEHRTIETQTAQTVKGESTNTIVKTPDGETIVIIQRPMEGAYPIGSNGIPIGVAQPQIIKQHYVTSQSQQDIKQIIIEQPATPQS